MDDYNGQEDDECEEIEEGVFDGTQLGKVLSNRTFNYLVEEDVSLVRAWETISLDSNNGTDQTGKRYWQRIEDKFFHFLPCGIEVGYRITPTATHSMVPTIDRRAFVKRMPCSQHSDACYCLRGYFK
jgi:hypothetical protein